jgi:thymidylate kinase|nr:MAG TPA: AAA domain protein [Bacteriophage sp.]
MQTIAINLIGAPGTGKSTIASELFAKMKWLGYDVELVSEYAKELVWEQRNETFKNELYLFAKQHHRMFRLNGKVKYIITDRPLILSIFYNQKYGNGSKTFRQLVLEETNKFQNINVFLNRTKPYVQNGRNQSEEESNEFAKEIFESLEKYCDGYLILDAVENQASEHILNFAKQE